MSKEGGRNSTTPEEQPHTEEEKTRPEGGITTDKHTASSMGSELQGDEKWARSVVMQKTSKPGAVVFYKFNVSDVSLNHCLCCVIKITI